MKRLRSILAIIYCSFSFVYDLSAQKVSPQLFLYAIKNETPYYLMVIDRLTSNTVVKVLPRTTVVVNYQIVSLSPIVPGSNIVAAMQQDAQFVVKQIDPKTGQPLLGKEEYMAFWFSTGGTHDGSGFVSGKPGYSVLKFFLVGKEGGVTRETITLKNQNTSSVSVNLLFTTNGLDVQLGFFKFAVDVILTEK